MTLHMQRMMEEPVTLYFDLDLAYNVNFEGTKAHWAHFCSDFF